MPKVAVLLVVYKRINLFAPLLRSLREQTFRDFDLHVINNNPAEKHFVQNLDQLFDPVRTTYVEADNSRGPFVRFDYAGKIRDRYDTFVIIDDDQIPHVNLVELLVRECRPDAVFAWHACHVPGYFFGLMTPNRAKTAGEKCDYFGPGGCVFHKSFLEKDVLEIPPEYYFLDDMWVSLCAFRSGMDIRRSAAELFDTLDSNHALVLQAPIAENRRQVFWKFMRDYGWPRPYSTWGVGKAKFVWGLKKLVKRSINFLLGRAKYPT